MKQYGDHLSRDCVNSVHQVFFDILDLLEHDSSKAPISPLISPSNPILDLTLRLGHLDPKVGFLEE